MRITQVFKDNSKSANNMRKEFNRYKNRTIYDAYVKPSHHKIASWYKIKLDYDANGGKHTVNISNNVKWLHYNNDLRVTGASTHFYSTIASFTNMETGEIWLIKETYANTYACLL